MASPLTSVNAARHFVRGKKEIYLPSFVVALIQTPLLPPTFAKFKVPLNMNKLDLRDYLYHGYGVRALSVRSFIKQRPVEANREGSNRREYFRRQAIKFMTVEMDEPFIWPKKPDNFDAWDKKSLEDSEKWREEAMEDQNPKIHWYKGSDGKPGLRKDRSGLAAEAKKLLSGRVKWQPTWKTLGKKYDGAVDSAASR